MKFSKFPAGIKNVKSEQVVTLKSVYQQIKFDDKLKSLSNILQNLPVNQQNDFKCSRFPYVTFGGVFPERKDEKIECPSGYVCIDIDDLDSPIDLKKTILKDSAYVLFLFISPKQRGLKIVFTCNPKFSFRSNYEAYSKYLINEKGVPADSIDFSCSNISRACFLSHDSDAFISNDLLSEKNECSSIPFLSDDWFIKNTPLSNDQEFLDDEPPLFQFWENKDFQFYPCKLNFDKRNDINNFISLCRLTTRDSGDFKVGNRHNWLLSLALKANNFGMTNENAIRYFKNIFVNHSATNCSENPFDEKNDLFRTFADVYRKYHLEFSSWNKDDRDWQTPFIADEVFATMPNFIKNLCGLFDAKRERDIFFLGLLTLLSTCFPKVVGIYDQRRYRANLYLFISAGAASGKGVLNWVRKVGQKIHDNFIDGFNEELAVYNELEEEEKKNTDKPVLKKLIIPSNNTSAKLTSTIEANKIIGLVFDTEADTITNANRSEHGHFSEIFRKVFQHEAIDYERKTSGEYISISDPAFSVLISGTPNQVKYLLKDVENGLTSRFIFYDYELKSKWKDVFAEKDDFEFKFLSESIHLEQLTRPYLLDYLLDNDNEILYSLTPTQQSSFNTWFSERSENLMLIYGNHIKASVFRMGLILFRISMILTIMRKIEQVGVNNHLPKNIFCDDQDFTSSIAIVDCLLHHSVSVLNKLKGISKSKNKSSIKDLFYERLPNEFNRQQAMEIANLMQIVEKTAENYLSIGIENNILIRIKHNHYSKL